MIKEITIENAFTNEVQPDHSVVTVVDPYTGCQLQCPYCFQMRNENWGKDIFVNTNIAELMKLQMKEENGNDLYFGSMCDPYMDLESRYRLTRKCLEVLSTYDSHIFITTKADNQLILEDIELLKNFKTPVTVLMGLSNVNQAGKGKHNVNIKVSNELKKQGLDVLCFITPFLPYVMNVEEILDTLDLSIPVYIDKLRVMTEGNQNQKVFHWIKSNYSEFSSEYENILFKNDENYYNDLVLRYRDDKRIKFMTEEWGA